jgi:acyl-CoA reductase-like NAD-dependent aldehyde dehydrogenase
MKRALGAARRAFDEGPWRKATPVDRARAIEKIADAMERRKEEMRALVVAEAAATHLTHGVQIDAPIAHLRHWAELVRTFDFVEALPPRPSQGPLGPQMNSTIVYRQPVGVCAMIPTWNFPIYVFAQKLGPALAAGCTMVFKASPYGPLNNLFMAELIAEADLPPGVVNVVTGQSNAIAEALVNDPRIDKISFTGSVATGRKIIQASASTLKRVHLELGGKSVSIFLDPDDGMAAPSACGPSFFHSGQGCAMATRVLVPADKHDAFVEKMVGFPRSYHRQPRRSANMISPVVRESAGRRSSNIESGRRTRRAGRRWRRRRRSGAISSSRRSSPVPNASDRAEIFGPVVSVIPFRTRPMRCASPTTRPTGSAGRSTRRTSPGP